MATKQVLESLIQQRSVVVDSHIALLYSAKGLDCQQLPDFAYEAYLKANPGRYTSLPFSTKLLAAFLVG